MIGIIFIGDMMYCPYFSKYKSILEKYHMEYHIIYWNRSGEEGEVQDNYISFHRKSVLNKRKIWKIKDFILYRKWLIDLMKSKKYNKLILLSTLSGMLVADILVKNYKHQYIFDIRDYSYENIGLYKIIEKILIKQSAFTTISSYGFKKFLPKEKYLITHNILLSEQKAKRKFAKTKNKKLNFVWMGSIRYFQHQKKIIEKLDRDGRFYIIFHGTGPELDLFKQYVKEHRFQHVYFTGKYSYTEKEKLLEKADILNNSYKRNKETRYAVSNKFYDGVNYHIPQLVETHCYKADIVNKYQLGIALDIEDKDFASKLYDYYFNLDEEKFNLSCDSLLHKIVDEEKQCIEAITRFIQG